jgi:DNA-binding SARP family transcriptional activator/tetratricopeptide (TPR) repeat protein
MVDSIGLNVRLFGRIHVSKDESEVDLGGGGPRSVFALLAMRANTTVTLAQLVDARWGDEPTRSARAAVYTYVSTLRKVLVNCAGGLCALTSSRAGYSLRLAPQAVDVHRFEEAAAQARRLRAAGDQVGAAGWCEAALSEWRGAPFGGAVGPFVESERTRLELVRLDVQELRCAALVETGRANDAIAELSVLKAENPLRERVHELLMLALCRAGRQAEALEVYQEVRRQLVDELGIEPGVALRQMQEHVLAGDDPGLPPTHPTHVIAAQVPNSVPHFIGREDELRRLSELCAAASGDGRGGAAVISAIDGTAGVGKTGLAIHLANREAANFPDGQLFLDLRGFDPRHPPMSSENALRHLLLGLGVGPEMLKSADLVDQVAMYRSMLAGRRMLVLLDNAVSAEQVRPLLPASKGCFALVTSRNVLAGLVARDGATRISLDVLQSGESLDLLRHMVGVDQVDADVDTARELATYCGHLPLTLRIVAERIAGNAYYRIADMVDELKAERDRLDGLSAMGDKLSAVRAVFSWSYQTLKPDDSRAFRLLGLHPGTEIGLQEAAALLGATVPSARRRLGGLVQCHLLEQVAPDRYRFHDLLRIYAAECAEWDESAAESSAAVERILTWYLGSVVAAREILVPQLGPIDIGEPDHEHPPVVLRNYQEANSWAIRELSTLVDVVRLASERGLDAMATKLATALGALCHCTSRWADWLDVLESGQAAAERTGDRASQGRLYNDAGVVRHYLGEHDEAVACHKLATEILTALDDVQDESIAANLAVAYSMMGRHMGALPLLHTAMKIAQQQGNRFVEAVAAHNVCAALSKLGRHTEAMDHGRRCVDLYRETGAEHMLGHGLVEVGGSCLRAGRVDEAIRHYRDALEVWRTLGDRWGEVTGMHDLAEAHHQAGRNEGARQLLVEALAILRNTPYLAADGREAAKIQALLTKIDKGER